MVEFKQFIAGTGIEVTFSLSDDDAIHFRFAQGLITKQEAERELKRSLNYYDTRRMEKLAEHLSIAY